MVGPHSFFSHDSFFFGSHPSDGGRRAASRDSTYASEESRWQALGLLCLTE